MNILELVDNDLFSYLITLCFSIGIYPFIDLMTPLLYIGLEVLKYMFSFMLGLYLYANLRYSLRIAYFVKEIQLMEKSNEHNSKNINNEEELNCEETNNEESNDEENNNKESNKEEQNEASNKSDEEPKKEDMKEIQSWDLDFWIESPE
jgi:hypothetical protein